MELVAYVSGIVVLVVAWLLYRVLAGTWNPWKLVEGADGRPSTSKLQWFIWTVVVVFSYGAVYAARAWTGHFEVIREIPANVLTAMGLSVATMAAAKGITVSYVAGGQVAKTKVDPKVDPQAAGPGSLVKDDDGFPDLSKIQMLVWTLVAVGIYLIRLVIEIRTDLQLPDIDPALMVLMGLGQGAYLGKKLTTTAVPRLTGLSPGSGKPKTEITITGVSLGENEKHGSLITIDGNPFHPEPAPDWQDTQIKFTIPAKQPNGSDWSAGQRISIGVIVGGQESVNTLPFTVTA